MLPEKNPSGDGAPTRIEHARIEHAENLKSPNESMTIDRSAKNLTDVRYIMKYRLISTEIWVVGSNFSDSSKNAL
jgi:hypothetical protein